MKPPQTMHDWLVSPTGQYMLRWEETYFRTLSEDIFGFNAVQIGLTELDTLKENRITHHWYSNPFLPADDMANPHQHNHDALKGLNGHSIPVSLTHTDGQLPFDTESIDLVTLPHTFDLAKSPHQLLREIHRILIPEGQIIISGFNPTSLWGIRQRWGRMTGNHFLPIDAAFISLPRMKDWLTLLGFETSRGYIGCYCPPCKSWKSFDRFAFMEKAGNRWWPYCGAVYLLCAIKQVPGMHLIGAAFKKETRRFFNAAPAQNKVSQMEAYPVDENE